MNEIFKKFNVFDYFSHLVPGAIVVLALLSYEKSQDIPLSSLCGNLSEEVKNNDIVIWTIFLVASHCIGLVNNVISDFVWYGFRNNAWLISMEKCFVHAKKNCSFIIKLVLVILTLSVLFSLPFITIDFAASVAFASVTFASVALALVALALLFLICISVYKKIRFSVRKKNRFSACKKFKRRLNSYYKDYELVKDKYPSNNISNLEAQIAFLRNSIIPLTLLAVLCGSENVFLRLAPFIAFAAFFLHQQKLYFHVYELCHIIDLNKGQEKKSPEIRIIINKTNNIHE